MTPTGPGSTTRRRGDGVAGAGWVPWSTVLPAPDGPAAAVPPAATSPRPSRVTPHPLGELAELIGAEPVAGSVNGVTAASTDVRPGDLFAALPGSSHHGIEYLPAALAAGAVAVLTDPAGAERLAGRLPALVVPDPRAVLGPLSA